MPTKKELIRLAKQLHAFDVAAQKKLTKTQEKFEKRYMRATSAAFEDMEQSVLKAISGFDSEIGIIKDNANNIERIHRFKQQWKRIGKRILKKGAEYFKNEGREIENLAVEQHEKRIKIMFDSEIDVGFEILSELAMKTAINRSIIIYGDSTGKFADEIAQGLFRKVFAGTSSDKLIEEYKAIIPSIEKPKRGGGMYRLSAAERAYMTVRTETIRLYGEVSDKLNQKSFGMNYWMINMNPMDSRTAEICREATEAGVMKRDQFITEHGLPGRHPRCRCSIGSVDPTVAEAIRI